ncbi:MAG: hypothetical protein LRY76_03890 [Alphaproteobacteria bacterium]|nr:hypothetical protein [Alphaproteobacteria bacterium]
MKLHVRIAELFAVYGEWRKEYGRKPFFSIHACNGETIIDIPYGQIIFTPRRILLAEKAAGNCLQGFHDGQSICVTEAFTRIANNRSGVSAAICRLPRSYFTG